MNQNLHEQATHLNNPHYHARRITWSAVSTGALVALGLTFLFNLFMLGLGLAGYSVNYHEFRNASVGTLIGGMIGGFILLLFAGWVTGKLIRPNLKDLHCLEHPLATPPTHHHELTSCIKEWSCKSALLHGFLAWVLYLILSLFVLALISLATSNAALNRLHHPANFYEYHAGEEEDFINPSNFPNRASLAESNVSERVAERVKARREAIREEREINRAGASAFGIFFLFSLGALAFCLGSYIGAHANKKKIESMHKV